MSVTHFSPEYTRDYALEDLKAHLERVKNGEKVTFNLYTAGGQGQFYDAEKISIMRKFVSLGGKINPNQRIYRYPNITALHTANYHGNQEMINFLIELGGDVEVVDYQGRKPRDCWINRLDTGIIKDDINFII